MHNETIGAEARLEHLTRFLLGGTAAMHVQDRAAACPSPRQDEVDGRSDEYKFFWSHTHDHGHRAHGPNRDVIVRRIEFSRGKPSLDRTRRQPKIFGMTDGVLTA